jgi:molybdenum cofactor cytidylyltransferase
VHNPDFAEGLSTSLRAGLAGLPADVDAALVLLGDMPAVDAAIIDRLIAAYDPASGALIVVPTSAGKRGNPVLWSSRFFADLAAVQGDTGGRHLIGAHPEAVVEVEVGAAVGLDIDTPEELAAAGGTPAAAS